jgi:hypothetical protein
MVPNDEHPTTTHAEPGAGRPRLVFTVGDQFTDGEPQREFIIVDDETLIGSAAHANLQLDRLLPIQAVIRHDERDEYVLFTRGDVTLGTAADGTDADEGHVLRTGFRLELGEWAMFFMRDEFADHGRPFGGRQGGEFEHQKPQPDRESEFPAV